MSVMEDLISFDIIETQKENIQSLPQGRSAKALAAQFGPTPFSPVPTPGATRTLNDAIRHEYETELQSIADADDPLDIYDRYVKWTINAYPSAQATAESQLRPLLERATKTFQGSSQYKNDVRYLKMWLNYIRLFSDAPRETYAYLSRHGIGDSLALFYEEFAAWLENAGRWTQAEEVYRLGIDKEARPAERLMRKFGEFQRRFEARQQDPDEPTSPALPTVRPALAAKLDPFATASAPDPQARRGLASSASSKSGRTKMAIFSDADGSSGSRPGSGASSKGWDNIGTIAERRKENVAEARPWVGETLKAGKKAAGPKMMVFKDQSHNASRSVIISTKNGKSEKWFADILNVCPNENDVTDEYCFEELRAKRRGWLDQTWSRPKRQQIDHKFLQNQTRGSSTGWSSELTDIASESTQTLSLGDDTSADFTSGIKKSKLRKKKLMEVKGETQTVKAMLDSPVKKPKLKRKKSAEPTMTLHTRAATDDILELFNQPLRNVGPIGSHVESDGDTDYDPDDYTCGVSSVGDNTRLGDISDAGSVYNDDETVYQSTADPAESTQPDSVSPWSDFSTRRHVPEVNDEQTKYDEEAVPSEGISALLIGQSDDQAYDTTLKSITDEPHTMFVPVPPEGFEPPRIPFRSAEQVAQSRLPFMTPIVEATEMSLGLPTIKQDRNSAYPRTPSRRMGDITEPITEIDGPLRDICDREKTFARDRDSTSRPEGISKLHVSHVFKKPLIEDLQLNPHDPHIRDMIIQAARLGPELQYFDHRPSEFNKSNEIRKFIKSFQKSSKTSLDRNAFLGPTLRFSENDSLVFNIRRELGKGAYAPVYLASVSNEDESEDSKSLVAIKSEEPPSAWEFYILSTLNERLTHNQSREVLSITQPLEFHHYSDEVYLIESYHDQGTLLDLVNIARNDPSLNGSTGASTGLPGLDECVAMFFAVELLRSVDAMHRAGILHGDLKADNCIVRLEEIESPDWDGRYDPSGSYGWSDKGLTLIDFGRSIDMTAFQKNVGFIADWKTSKDDCAEMRELRPWTYQVDYWGAAGVLHVLLFGKWIEDVVAGPDRRSVGAEEGETNGAEKTMVVGRAGVQKRKLKEGLKRYWQTALWADVFDLLMNSAAWVDGEEGSGLPATGRLQEIIAALEQWLVENSEKRGLKMQLKRLADRTREIRRRD